MADKNSSSSKTKSAKETKVTKVKKPTKTVKSVGQTKIIVDEQSTTVNVVPIEYSKYNPKLPFQMSNIWWNVLKYGLAITLTIFAILGLYFSTVWQAQSNGDKPAIGTLMQIKIVHKDGKLWEFSEIFTSSVGADAGRAQQLNDLNALVPKLVTLSLFDLVPWFTNEMLVTLMTFSIIGILGIIPLLIFRNGTVCSLTTLTIGCIFAIIIIAMFSVGINAQNTILNPFNDIQNTCSKIEAFKKSNNSIYEQNIIDLNNHLNVAIDNFLNLFK